jgi:hypothetical protein
MDLTEIVIDGVNWIRLAQDGVHWRAFVSTFKGKKGAYPLHVSL